MHREKQPKRPSAHNGSPYLERHGGTQLRDSLAHPASGAAQAGGCTETLETLEGSGPVLRDRRRGWGPGRSGSRSAGSPGSALPLASREGVVPLPPAAPGLTAITTQAQTTLPRGLRGRDVLPRVWRGRSLLPRPSHLQLLGFGDPARPPGRPVGLAGAHAQVQTPRHPHSQPCTRSCIPSSTRRFLSASCAGARWGCAQEGPAAPEGPSRADPARVAKATLTCVTIYMLGDFAVLPADGS